jgi:uncharacterized protein
LAGPHFPSRAPLQVYGGGCFRFAGAEHRGSLLILPSGIHGWRPAGVDELRSADLDPILAERSGIGILLFGTGPAMSILPQPLRGILSAAGIGLEMMDTGAAVRTYNILLAEDREVAAALLVVP